MPNMKIIEINNNKYTLQNAENNETHTFNITFFGLETLPKVGEFIRMHSQLLNKNYEEYSSTYQFGPLDEPYGRVIKSPADIDCILVESNNKKTYLKRFFG